MCCTEATGGFRAQTPQGQHSLWVHVATKYTHGGKIKRTEAGTGTGIRSEQKHVDNCWIIIQLSKWVQGRARRRVQRACKQTMSMNRGRICGILSQPWCRSGGSSALPGTHASQQRSVHTSNIRGTTHVVATGLMRAAQGLSTCEGQCGICGCCRWQCRALCAVADKQEGCEGAPAPATHTAALLPTQGGCASRRPHRF